MAEGAHAEEAGIQNIVGKAVGDDTMDVIVRANLANPDAAQLSSAAMPNLDKMKKEYGRGAATLVSIANATGADMQLVRVVNYRGHVWRYPVPLHIRPGQVGSFLHVKNGMFGGSKAGIVYRVKNAKGNDKDVFLGFNTGFFLKERYAFVIARDKGHWGNRRGRVHEGDEFEEYRRRQKKEDESKRSTRMLMKQDIGRITTCDSDEDFDVRLTANLGQGYCPLCQFFVGYPEMKADN